MVRVLLDRPVKRLFLSCLFSLLVMVLAGCTEDYYYEHAGTDYTKVDEHELVGDYSIKARALSGKIVAPSETNRDAFVPEKVLLVLLDSNLAEGDTLKGKIVKDDFVGYEFSKRDYTTPYVKIVVKGKWKFLSSKAVPFTMETICDISSVEEPRVDLMTHLEVPLVTSLVDEGYPVKAAKQIAVQKFAESFGLNYPGVPAEAYGRELVEMVPMYALFLHGGSDGAFVENVEDFRLDLADGAIDDSLMLVKFADYIVENWSRLDSILQKFNKDSSLLDWQYAEGLVERIYGLDSCRMDSTSKIVYVDVDGSRFKGDSLVCDQRAYRGEPFYRIHYPLERLLGTCADSIKNAVDYAAGKDSVVYVCRHERAEYGMLDDSTFGIETWRKASYKETRDFYLGPCDKEALKVEGTKSIYNEEIKKTYKDTIYVCRGWGWNTFKAVEVDTLDTLPDTTHTDVDTLDEMDSLARECKTIADTSKYHYDSLSEKFYHCEVRNNVIKFYEMEDFYGREYFCGEFAKTLDACTAESDTTLVISCPYNVKEAGVHSMSDGYYHCSHVDGGYTYVQIPYWDVKRYNSLHESGSLEPCNPQSDTLEYKRDSYGFYYYCVEEGGEWKNELISDDDLRDKLADLWIKTLEPCDVNGERWRRYYNKFLNDYRYAVCDYDMDSNFTFLRVDQAYYLAYAERVNFLSTKVPLEACSVEQMAARGTPVGVKNGTITDPRDGRSYRVVTIGEQTWMAENLGYYDTLAVPSLAERSECSDDTALCSKTGRLYYWDAVVGVPSDFNADTLKARLCEPVQGICPAGWHVPSLDEWSRLFQYVSYHNDGTGYGGSLKAETGWYAKSREKDLFGFSVAPVSWITNETAYFATSDIFAKATIRRMPMVKFTYSLANPEIKGDIVDDRSISVRCVKD